MRPLIPLFVLFACTEPAVDSAPGTVPLSTPAPPTEPQITGDAPDFEILVQDGSTFRLWDHAGDVILIDMSGFT